jgi:hypothetical protein
MKLIVGFVFFFFVIHESLAISAGPVDCGSQFARSAVTLAGGARKCYGSAESESAAINASNKAFKVTDNDSSYISVNSFSEGEGENSHLDPILEPFIPVVKKGMDDCGKNNKGVKTEFCRDKVAKENSAVDSPILKTVKRMSPGSDFDHNSKQENPSIGISDYLKKKVTNIKEIGTECLRIFSDGAGDNRYLTTEFKEMIDEFKVDSISPESYTELSQCNDAFGGAGYVSRKELRVSASKSFCRDLFMKTSTLSKMREVASINPGTSREHFGENCLKPDLINTDMSFDDEVAKSEGNEERNCGEKLVNYNECHSKNSENCQSSASPLECMQVACGNLDKAYKTCQAKVADIEERRGNVVTGDVRDGCKEKFAAIKNLISDSFKTEIIDLVGGCASLQEISRYVIDEVLENGENSYFSLDKKIECHARRRPDQGSAYALDYEACSKAAYWYNGAFLVNDLAAPVILNATEAMDGMDVQSDMQRDLASGGIDAQSAALRAQRKTYQNKADSEKTKGTLQTGRALAMFGNMMKYPTEEVISGWIVSGQNDLGLESVIITALARMAQGNSEIRKDLFLNGKAKEVMLQTGAMALSKAVVHAIVSKTYDKQAKLVGKVEDTLKEADFNQAENAMPDMTTFCLENPLLPSCSGVGTGRVSSGDVDFSFDGITPQGGGNVDFDTSDRIGGAGNDTNSAVGNRSAGGDDLSNILGESSDKKFGNKFNKIAAGGVTASGGGAGGGSGGGGAGAGGGGGGGSGDDPARRGTNGPSTATGKKTSGAYVTGQAGKFSSGGSLRSKKKSVNAFANLGRGRKGRRKIASQDGKELLPKKVKLFEVISKRYAEVSKSDRLYKLKRN